MDKTLKGSLEGVLPMTGLLILAAILATQSLPVAEALASVLDESSTEISSTSISHAKGDYIGDNFIPDAANYSINNGAYFLGRNNAGISWERPLDSPSEMYAKMEDKWIEESNNRLSSYIEDSTDCEIENRLNLMIYPDTSQSTLLNSRINKTNFSVTNEASNDAYSVKCSTSRYDRNEYKFAGSSPNRYAALANFTAEFFNETEKKFENADVKSTYQASQSYCDGTPSSSYVENLAFSKYNSDVPEISDIKREINTPVNTSFDGDVFNRYTVILDKTENDGTCTTDCPDEGEPGTCDEEPITKRTVRISPDNSKVETETTAEEKLNIDNAWKKIRINVDEYLFRHD